MATRLASASSASPQVTDLTRRERALRLLRLRVMADLDSDVACTNAYSDIEEDFFRVGEAMSAGTVAEPIAADPEPVRGKSIWSRLFERPLRLPTEDLVPATPHVEDTDHDEWDWMLAVARARARHATQPGI